MSKRVYIEKMFDRISGKYDKLNNLLSFFTHWIWKKQLVSKIRTMNPESILDAATGTGDIAYLCKKFCPQVHGVDISRKMLAIAKHKHPDIKFTYGDLCDLDFKDENFDVSVISFGIRNVEDLSKALDEVSRVTKRSAFILEFGSPQNKLWRKIYFKSMTLFIPLIGMLFKDKNAYTYLIESSMAFPSHHDFLKICPKSFYQKSMTPIWGGIAYIYQLDKENS